MSGNILKFNTKDTKKGRHLSYQNFNLGFKP